MIDELIVQAFDFACGGFSPDRVVADPELNEQFIKQCRSLGMVEKNRELNQRLLNIRKRGALSGRPRSKRTSFEDQEQYIFAAEIAARYIERQHSTSLDTIMCDDELVAAFDAVACRIAPGYSKLQYRWAALSLRKAKKLKPELASRLVVPVKIVNVSVNELELSTLPTSQGLYLFFDHKKLLYVGETKNLRSRLKKHLDHSDNKGLAHWVWEHGTSDLNIEIQILEQNTSDRARKALETELIRSRSPLFNIKR